MTATRKSDWEVCRPESEGSSNSEEGGNQRLHLRKGTRHFSAHTQKKVLLKVGPGILVDRIQKGMWNGLVWFDSVW